MKRANEGRPKTNFLFVSPVLASSDVQRDVDWWDGIGFKNGYDSSRYQEGPLDYAVVRGQDLLLHLQFQFTADMTSTDVKFAVKNIRPLIEDFMAKGLLDVEKVQWKTPWNTSEFAIFDTSGNRLTFLEDL